MNNECSICGKEFSGGCTTRKRNKPESWLYLCDSCMQLYFGTAWRSATCGECGYMKRIRGVGQISFCREKQEFMEIDEPACPDFDPKDEPTP